MALPDQSIGQSAKTFYNSLGGINIMDQTIVAQYSLIAAALIACVAALAAAFSDSRAACKALEGMTRQPEMAGKLFKIGRAHV